MVTEKFKCANCFHTISNPVCPDCFIGEISSWIYELDISSEIRRKVLEKLPAIVLEADRYPADIQCIFCKSDEVSLCSYCLLLKVKKIIEDVFIDDEADPTFLKQFEDLFNYSIWLR